MSLTANDYDILLNDPKYLLRCALTHDWDNLTRFCTMVLTELFTVAVPDSYQERHWQRVNAARQQLLKKDPGGNSVLQAACYIRPLLRAVAALLTAASVARPEPIPLTECRARDDSTALQVACAAGSLVQVIRALLSHLRRLHMQGLDQLCGRGICKDQHHFLTWFYNIPSNGAEIATYP
jgi:hypothetical protein